MSEALTSPIANAFAETLIHFLWQGLLLAIGYWIVQDAFGFQSPSKRYLAALGTLSVMAVCPVVTFCVVYQPLDSDEISRRYESADEQDLAAEVASMRETDDFESQSIAPHTGQRARAILNPSSSDTSFLPFTLMLWLAGVLLSGMRLLAGYFNIAWLRWGRVKIGADLALRSQQLATRIGLVNADVFTSDRIREAAVVGFWKPVVLLPASWVVALPTDVLEAVIAHELAHIRRHDVWINLFQRIVETLLFYHPAVWWLSNRARMERELCCDELAIQATGQRKVYAMALEQVGRLQLNGAYRLATPFRGDRQMNLLRRVKHVLQIGQPSREPAWLIGVVAIAVPVAFLCAFGGFGDSSVQAIAQEREGGRSAEAETGPRRSPEAEAGPRRSPEAEAGPRRSPEAEAGPRRSAESDAERRRSSETDARDEAINPFRGFRPQTERETALLEMIERLQKEMAELRREVRANRERERPVDRDRVPEAESVKLDLPENWQRTKEGRVFQAYDKNGDQVVDLEEWLAMTNGNINDARRAVQTRRFREAEPSGDGKFMPAEFVWWYKIGRHNRTEEQPRDRDVEERARGERDGDRRDREDERGRRDDDDTERRPRDGERPRVGERDGERAKDGPRDSDRPKEDRRDRDRE